MPGWRRWRQGRPVAAAPAGWRNATGRYAPDGITRWRGWAIAWAGQRRTHRTHVPADPPEPESMLAAVRELRASLGIDARRIDALGCLLTDGEFRSVAELVSLTGTSRRTVEAVLRAAEPHLDTADGRVRIGGPHAAAYAAEFGCGQDAPMRDAWD